MKNAILVILSLCFTAVTVLGQSSHKLLRQGNKFYDIEEFGLAEEKYRKSQLEENQSKTSFNLGNALYKQGRFEEAAEEFQKATAGSMENIEKAKVFHNLGNAQLQAQKLEEALNAAIQLSRRYIADRQLPDKAISLLDTACAKVAGSQASMPGRLSDVASKIVQLQSELKNRKISQKQLEKEYYLKKDQLIKVQKQLHDTGQDYSESV